MIIPVSIYGITLLIQPHKTSEIWKLSGIISFVKGLDFFYKIMDSGTPGEEGRETPKAIIRSQEEEVLSNAKGGGMS